MSNGLLTSYGLGRALDVGFNLPQSVILPNTAEQVAIVTVAAGQLLELRWFSLHLVKLNSTVNGPPTKVNPSLGTAFAGLYGDRAQLIEAPAGQPLAYIYSDLPGAAKIPAAYAFNLSPGTYSILAVNNLLDASVEVSVNGVFRVTTP